MVLTWQYEDIKRWKQYTELYRKDLHDPENHHGVITHPEPDSLECEVKRALGSITKNKASGGDGISVELFQILKDGAVKVLYSMCQQIWKTQQWPQGWKRSVFILISKKGNAKECSNYQQLHSSHTLAMEKAMTPHSSTLAWKIPWMEEPGRLQSMGSLRVGHDWSDLAAAAYASKVMVKILQARLQQYVNHELPDVQAGFRKDRGTRNQIANTCWIIEKGE